MKVALVGNMNNIHFAFLRYLRDLNVDADLFLYKNEQSHFSPDNDTWEIEKWKSFIYQTDICNGFYKYDLSMLYYPSKKIKSKFEKYDIIICNGSFPIYAYRAGLMVDFFLPYAVGVEFLSLSRSSIKRLVSTRITRYLQSRAINNVVKRIVTLDFTDQNLINFNILNKDPEFLGLPMLYPEKPKELNDHLLENVKCLDRYELVVFSHVSHIWKNIPGVWSTSIKQNNILIEGFGKFVNDNPSKAGKSKLVLLEYGTDVEASKELIKNLKIDDYVMWVPQMSRKELMVLLDYADFGGGEFGGLIWGGTGWEFMSAGVPFFQYVDSDPNTYNEKTGVEFPSIINTNSPVEIADHLQNYFSEKEYYQCMGLKLKKWFEDNAGLSLVKKYLQLMQNDH